jgi:hypothetical protein
MILNGYPDGLFNETVTAGDSAVFVPGTKIVEPRSFPGLNNMSVEQLRSCMANSGYIRDSDVFDASKGNTGYLQFKQQLNLPKFRFKNIPALLTFDNFTKVPYMVTPVNNDTLRVKLYFDASGKSYFINTLGDISESGINTLPSLAQTEIEGYLYPFPENTIFYPFDIKTLKGTDVSGIDYYGGNNKRWDKLNDVIQILNATQKSITLDFNFDLDIVRGSNYYLTNYPEISGLLFIPYRGNDIRLWNDSIHESNITIALNASNINRNRWSISVGGKFIPTTLVQQGPSHDIEIPIAFTKGKEKELIILFRINLRKTDFKIENRKPFIPLEVLDQQINTYDEVISILESINNPISRATFIPEGFLFNGKLYMFTQLQEPLTVRSV